MVMQACRKHVEHRKDLQDPSPPSDLRRLRFARCCTTPWSKPAAAFPHSFVQFVSPADMERVPEGPPAKKPRPNNVEGRPAPKWPAATLAAGRMASAAHSGMAARPAQIAVAAQTAAGSGNNPSSLAPTLVPTAIDDPVPGVAVLPTAAGSTAAVELREELAEAFLLNEMSGTRVRRIMERCTRAGAAGVADLAACGAGGRLPGNVHRDLIRGLRRGTPWPAFYYTEIPVLDSRTQTAQRARHPFLLPHEWLAAVVRRQGGSCDPFVAKEDSHPHFYQHVQKLAGQLQFSPAACICLGMHGDGVPFGRAGDSLECFSFNLPCSAAKAAVRIPFTVVQKRYMVKRETFEAILEVMKWSLQMLALGRWPEARHDGTPFTPDDKKRAKAAGQSLNCHGLLVELRGDWCFFKQCFNFPAWNSQSGLCWRCKATPSNYRDCGSNASWRLDRLGPLEFLKKMIEEGGRPSVLFSAPGVHPGLANPDWMHAADLGITADAAGNILLELADFLPGPSRAARTAVLWAELQEWYRTTGTPYKLDILVPELFIQPKKAPKLRAKAAVVRHMVPFLQATCSRHWSGGTTHQRTVCSLTGYLAACYACLEAFDAEKLAANCRKFALLLVALEQEAQALSPGTRRWRVKPKLHLFQELCEMVAAEKGSPRLFWCYRDEDFGGFLQKMSGLRGGRNTNGRTAGNTLVRFVSLHQLPVEAS